MLQSRTRKTACIPAPKSDILLYNRFHLLIQANYNTPIFQIQAFHPSFFRNNSRKFRVFPAFSDTYNFIQNSLLAININLFFLLVCFLSMLQSNCRSISIFICQGIFLIFGNRSRLTLHPEKALSPGTVQHLPRYRRSAARQERCRSDPRYFSLPAPQTPGSTD